jgi:hypothetical protein
MKGKDVAGEEQSEDIFRLDCLVRRMSGCPVQLCDTPAVIFRLPGDLPALTLPVAKKRGGLFFCRAGHAFQSGAACVTRTRDPIITN